MAEELHFMVCMRVDELEGEPMPGSTTTACVECGTDIWLAPDSRKFATEQGAMPLCSRCAVDMADQHDSTVTEFGMMVPPGTPEPTGLKDLISKLRDKADRYQSIGDRPGWVQREGRETDLFEELKETAKAAEQELTGPEDDWGSLMEIESWEGVSFPAVPLSDMLRKGVPKKVIAHQMVPALIFSAEGKRVVIGLSSRTLGGKEPGEMPDIDGPISEHPDRKEMLVLIDITAEGVQAVSAAEITRDGIHGPKLGEWKDSENPAAGDGLFVEAIVPCLKLVKELREKYGPAGR